MIRGRALGLVGGARSISLLILLGAFGQGCDTSGIHPLGIPTNTVDNCAKSTWARSTDTGTELFLFSEALPTTPVGEAMDAGVGEGGSTADVVVEPHCFIRMAIEHDSSTTMEQGTYVLGADGHGVFTVEHAYVFVYFDSSVKLGARDGALRNDMPAPASHSIEIEADGDQILVDVDGDTRRLTNLYDVIAKLDPKDRAGAEDLFRVLNLAIYSSAVRIPGFGSAKMSSYINNTTTFKALVASDFTVGVGGPLLNPVTDIVYDQFEDLSGIVLDGDQRTVTNLYGNGSLSGVLDWRLRSSDEDVFLEGTLDYEGLVVVNGVAGDGTYTLTVGGSSYTISYDLAADMDLRTLLPVEAP
jgi:hypothetical protein